MGTTPGSERKQRGEITAIEREIVDLLGLNDRSEAGVGDVELCGGSLHINHLVRSSDGQGEVERRSLVDSEDEGSGFLRFEARGVRFDGVSAGNQVENRVSAGTVGDGLVIHVGVDVAHGDGGVRNDSTTRVADRSIDRCGRKLRQNRQRKQQRNDRNDPGEKD